MCIHFPASIEWLTAISIYIVHIASIRGIRSFLYISFLFTRAPIHDPKRLFVYPYSYRICCWRSHHSSSRSSLSLLRLRKTSEIKNATWPPKNVSKSTKKFPFFYFFPLMETTFAHHISSPLLFPSLFYKSRLSRREQDRIFIAFFAALENTILALASFPRIGSWWHSSSTSQNHALFQYGGKAWLSIL